MLELVDGDGVRVRTHGDGPFVETVARVDRDAAVSAAAATVSNYSGGEQVGASWTDHIMAVKASRRTADVEKAASCDEGAGAADDEWDD